jgi:hypothetical protein
MNPQPRFQAEFFIRQSIEELQNYANVFHERIAKAFDGLEAEAKRVEQDAYANHPDALNPDCDPSVSAEWAYFRGVDYYLAVDAVRQGIVNLMVAGIFHLVEQQAQYLATQVLSNPVVKPHPDGGFKQLCGLLKSSFGVDVTSFKSWSLLNELRLVANTIKHGGGKSAEELRQLNPDLFKFPGDPSPSFAGLPLRPLVGEGLWLTTDHFSTYKTCVEQLWDELTLALLPHFCPP